MEHFSDLLLTLPHSVQTHRFCTSCRLLFPVFWIRSHEVCLFCMSAADMSGPSRAPWIRAAEWVYLQSGSEEMSSFYEAYFHEMHRWCDAKQIPRTHGDQLLETDKRREATESDL